MAITFDPVKRDKALAERGRDFLSAERVFGAPRVTFEDDRKDYGEIRLVTVGTLDDPMVVVCWTLRGDDRHAFSMRRANDREPKKYASHLR